MLRVTILFLLLVISPLAYCLDSNIEITQYNRDTWQIAEGLPQNSIMALIQSHEGYIWLGTHEGLVRFDGVRFTVFDKRTSEGVLNNDVLALMEDDQGSIWFGTYGGGLTRLRAERLVPISQGDGLADNIVSAILDDGRDQPVDERIALRAVERAAEVAGDLRVAVERRERGTIPVLPLAQEEPIGRDHLVDVGVADRRQRRAGCECPVSFGC